MTHLFSSTRLIAAASFLTLAAGFVAAPVSFDVGRAGIALASTAAFARNGADDGAGDDRGGNRGGDDRGGHHGGDDRGGHRGGDDKGGARSGDDRGNHRTGDDHGGNRSGKHGRGLDDGPNHR